MKTILYHSKDEICFFRTVRKLLVFEYGQFKHALIKQACLTKACYAGCHTRWRGQEFHLCLPVFLSASFYQKIQQIMQIQEIPVF